MANANQVTGRVFVAVNGNRLTSKPGAKLTFGGVEREGVAGDSGVHGYMEKTSIPAIDCTISHKGDTSLTDLRNITDASLTFQTDTGHTFLVRNAWCANALELTNGEVTLKFEGVTCEEA